MLLIPSNKTFYGAREEKRRNGSEKGTGQCAGPCESAAHPNWVHKEATKGFSRSPRPLNVAQGPAIQAHCARHRCAPRAFASGPRERSAAACTSLILSGVAGNKWTDEFRPETAARRCLKRWERGGRPPPPPPPRSAASPRRAAHSRANACAAVAARRLRNHSVNAPSPVAGTPGRTRLFGRQTRCFRSVGERKFVNN